MSFTVPSPSRRPTGRARVLLALTAAVFVGLLAMHGLSPAPAAVHGGAHSGGHGVVTVAEHHDGRGGGHCAHDGGGSGTAHHADAACAAAGIGASYAPPPLAVASGATPEARPRAVSAAVAQRVERAPPDLAELQLLRI
ncbi:DUF6153 family protein [Streptomyces sp. NPDC049813]|uniref:DUF6153 family protein n=1 Tax=Streptomyces sp. NPDC049813 TaxID=3365597 RepID=UPI00378B4E12